MEQGKTAKKAGGLEGVVVAETELSLVDGEAGRLVYRGHSVEALAGRVSYEAVLALLLQGALPSAAEEEAVRAALGRARVRAFERLGALGDALTAADGMEALRAATAHVFAPALAGAKDLGAASAASTSVELGEATALAGAVAVYAAAWARRQRGLAPLPPDPHAGHAADFLRLATGEPVSAARAAAVDTYFVTVAEHGMNASTFTARVVTSTQSDAASAVVAAIGALKGPLHGGAPGPVLDMLDAVGSPERAGAWLQAELAAGRRIMGMGHRIYRVRDPRAAVLETATSALLAAGVSSARLKLARAVEEEAVRLLAVRHPGRALRANVEFYTATLLDAVGLPRTLFSPTFAAARVAGWCAHIAEQRRDGRLIRPQARYVGALPAA